MNVCQTGDWLARATGLLKDSQVPSAHLDALILLEDALKKDRAYLLAHPETPVRGATLEMLEKQLLRRSTHEPLAYIRGRSEFYGRNFQVSPATLQPRPETETIITELKNMLEHKNSFSGVRSQKTGGGVVIADLGTGSGAIAITAKLELPKTIVHATEILPESLAIAHKNAKDLGANVAFYEGNLLEPLYDVEIDIILANLPYVPSGHTINEAAMQEPAVAIFGGKDGLDLYRKMFRQISLLRQQPSHILTESLPFQHKPLAKIAQKAGYAMQQREDFIQVFLANKPGLLA